MTVSAVAKLMPRPPALVDSKKQKSCSKRLDQKDSSIVKIMIYLRVFSIEVIQCLLSQFSFNAAIQSLEGEMPLLQVLGKYVQHPDHLGENQDSVACFSQAYQQFVEQDKFTRTTYKILQGKATVKL